MGPPELLQMTPELYRLRIPGDRAYLLNCYLWIGDGLTVIDTGWPDSAPVIADALGALGRRPGDVARIVLTHFHDDHSGSAGQLADWSGAEVVTGAEDAPFVRGAAAGPLPELTGGERALFGGDFTAPPQGPPCKVDRTVRDGDVLDFAGGARVIGVPGHTPGSIALHLPAADALLTGDTVAEFDGALILGVFNVDRDQAQRDLTSLAQTGAQIAGFGHGEPVLDGASDRIATATDPFGPDYR